MYEQHWGLKARPFENTTDSHFYYPGESHQGALLKLRYVLEQQRGAAVLSGAAGMGKSLLLRVLARMMTESCAPWVSLVFPQLPADQIVAFIADELCGDAALPTLPTHHHVRRIRDALTRNAKKGKHAVLVIDEAHLLDGASLEAIRLLLNFEVESACAMTIFLAGQPALLPTLDRTPDLDERLSVKCLLRRFSSDETAAYISHRLKTAGTQATIFNDAALESVHQLSHGTPRRINRLCDLALLVGFAEELSEIGPVQIESVAEELATVSPE